MPSEAGRITFAPVTAAHFPLLLDWLNRAHVREWWGEAETELGHIRDMVEGRDTTRPFVIEFDGRPIGYIQYWFLADNRDETTMKEAPWLAELLADTVGIDLTIGEEDLLSKGIGAAAVKLMVRHLLEAGHTNIIIDPDPENRRAVRAYEKAGFRPVDHLEGRTEGALIMQYDRQNETNT
ncbi:GNAT family N-acetyltransferase [Nitratireductor soli]|uniref:GNAT family N-acetyltransferase n=1 Tax=Nitratireductor soli TaxID=1670619 RepID=UPI00065E8CB2|nr:GNAT family N-acetyltransferase [Nitratireductor soli]